MTSVAMVRASSLHKVQAHDEGVWCLAWVPGSQRLLTGSVDETVKSWEVDGDKSTMQHNYLGHTLGAIALAAEASGQYAASSALDSTIRVWNLETHTTKSIIETPPTETWGIAFGPAQGGDALLMAAAGGSTGKVKVHKAGGAEDPAEVASMDMPQVSNQQ